MSRTPEYKPGEFQWSFLLPQYWGIWVGIVFLMILAILPWAIQHRLADLLGQMAFKYLKSRRETTLRNLEVCFRNGQLKKFRTMPVWSLLTRCSVYLKP